MAMERRYTSTLKQKQQKTKQKNLPNNMQGHKTLKPQNIWEF